jgi:riboflavin kinase/FMN adenylyltransferase
MVVHQRIEGLRALSPGAVLSIGNFDGVHRGHLKIVELARQLRAKSGGRVALVTFEPHPLTVLRPDKPPPPRLTPLAMKRSLLEAMGVDDLVELAPTKEVLALSAEQFFAILRDQVRPAYLIEGESFNFGRDRGGSIQDLRRWTARSAIELHVIEAVTAALLDMQLVDVNSSLIRWLVTNGRARDAAICLGRPYSVQGVVVEGRKRGRTIGVPTANINVVDQLIPADGVYAASCTLDHHTYPAAVSIGSLPTFNGNKRQVEAHLIGYEGELYGRTIAIDVIDWLREQRKFPGIDSLKSQISRDIAETSRRAGVTAIGSSGTQRSRV